MFKVVMKNQTTFTKTKEELIKLSGSELFEQALTHRGFLKSQVNNERLEFLGDAIFNFLGAELLFNKYSDWDEGDLTKQRARLLSGSNLAQIAKELGFQNYIKVQEEQDRHNSRLLAGVLEAYTAAVYLKGGISSVREWVQFLFQGRLNEKDNNYKSQLQEWCQKTYQQLPSYRLTKEEGEDHNKIFHIEIVIKNELVALGQGLSKRKAQQDAAEKALKKLKIFHKVEKS